MANAKPSTEENITGDITKYSTYVKVAVKFVTYTNDIYEGSHWTK